MVGYYQEYSFPWCQSVVVLICVVAAVLAVRKGSDEMLRRSRRRLVPLAAVVAAWGPFAGVIKAFGAVANADPAYRATLLTEGISEAIHCLLAGSVSVFVVVLIFFVAGRALRPGRRPE